MENKLKQEECGMCEIMGESNQVHQLLKLFLKKNPNEKLKWICEDMSKSKNANRVKLIIYLWLKLLIFQSF